MYAALANFGMYCIATGWATLTERMTVSVEIIGLGIYVYDSFDFEGEQALGRWKLPDQIEITPGVDRSRLEHGDMKHLCPEDWAYLSNWEFRMYRNEWGGQFGEDFLVFSDVKSVAVHPVMTFEYPAPDFIKGRFGK
jgi:hypothetical protein